MDSNLSIYGIRDVAQMTGVNPVTLRAWQRRYGLVNPQRSSKGHRLYCEQDIAQIRQIVGLLDKGIAIRHVKALLQQHGDEKFMIEGQLEHVDQIYEALIQRQLNLVMQLINEALKEYPIQVVDQRLFQVLDAKLRQPPMAGSELVHAIWHHCIQNRAHEFVQASQRSHDRKLYVIVMANSLSYLGWWQALLLTQQNWHVIVLEGMREQLNSLSPLLANGEHLAIYSDAKLTAVQIHKLRQLVNDTGCDLKFYGLHASLNQHAMTEGLL